MEVRVRDPGSQGSWRELGGIGEGNVTQWESASEPGERGRLLLGLSISWSHSPGS